VSAYTMGDRRRRPFWIGMLRTGPFIMAGILSLVLFYFQAGLTLNWNRDPMIGLIFCLLCATVYFTVSQQLPYSKKNIIEDLLDASLYQLGDKYRINIMELVAGEGHAYFKITYGRGYRDTSKYKKQINMAIPGASEAWDKGGPIYHVQSELLSEIDNDVKHLWSVGIKGRRGQSVAILNIDNIIDDEVSDETKTHISNASLQLAELIGYYWEIPS